LVILTNVTGIDRKKGEPSSAILRQSRSNGVVADWYGQGGTEGG
jgi:hypothetical protein